MKTAFEFPSLAETGNAVRRPTGNGDFAESHQPDPNEWFARMFPKVHKKHGSALQIKEDRCGKPYAPTRPTSLRTFSYPSGGGAVGAAPTICSTERGAPNELLENERARRRAITRAAACALRDGLWPTRGVSARECRGS
jgi:hypothetical protein